MATPESRPRAPKRWRWGRGLARVACLLFGLVGALPVFLAVLVRSDSVRDWAAEETVKLVQQELGVTASYRVEIGLWPLALTLADVTVPANDRGAPVLQAKQISVRPRLFSLLTGKLDVGEVEIESPRIRAVVRGSKLQNLDYKLPEAPATSKEKQPAPFSSIAISDARLDLDVDGRLIRSGTLDLDAYAEDDGAFEIALRVSELVGIQTRAGTRGSDAEADHRLPDAVDEDIVCRLEIRLRYSENEVWLRRFSLLGVADNSDLSDTLPSCLPGDVADNPNRIALRLSQVRAQGLFAPPESGEKPLASGHVVARMPLMLLRRYTGVGLEGWAGMSGDLRYDGKGVLPQFRGRVRGGGVALDGYALAKRLDAQVTVREDRVIASRVQVGWSDGQFDFRDVELAPLAEPPTITARSLEAGGVTFPGLMRDLDVTRGTVVRWDLEKIAGRNIRGTLAPLKIDGELVVETDHFRVFDEAWNNSGRAVMLGIRGPALVRTRFGVRPDAFEFYDVRGTFGDSRIEAPIVSIGFSNRFKFEVDKSRISLADLTPLVGIPWAGEALLQAETDGSLSAPEILGLLKIKDFEFGGFAIADEMKARTRFRPLKLELLGLTGRKGKSHFESRNVRMAFDEGSSVLLDADVRSPDLDVKDFFAMWGFDRDPRFAPIHGHGSVNALVHFDYGGSADRCGSGLLTVSGAGLFEEIDLYEEKYDSASANFRMRWDDQEAGIYGMEFDAPAITLTKGRGTVLASAQIRKGAKLRGHGVATGVPLSEIQGFGVLASLVEGQASGVAEVFGTLDAIAVDASVDVSPVQIGASFLPASRLGVKLRPKPPERRLLGHTKCGGPVTAEFNRRQWDRDEVQGIFHVDGSLFGGQVKLVDLKLTQQRDKIARGIVEFEQLDLGALSELDPRVAQADSRPTGRLSARMRLAEYPVDRPIESSASIELTELSVDSGRLGLQLLKGAKPVELRDGKLNIAGLSIAVRADGGQQGVFDLLGSVSDVTKQPNLDLSLRLRPISLAKAAKNLPGVERASGTVRGQLRAQGPLDKIRYSGGFELLAKELAFTGLDSSVTDVELGIGIDSDELRITRGFARLGKGTLKLGGSAKLRGFDVLDARAVITATNLAVPVSTGIAATVNSTLVATWSPPGQGAAERRLPRVTGTVDLKSFRYTRPVLMSADISTLAQRGTRTEFESYDPADDFVELDITIRASRPLTLSNNLLDAELAIGKKGLLLAGTNQRFGLRGDLRVRKGGRIRLRRNEFEIRSGRIRFDDLTEIRPEVDVTAVTEYRRYSGGSGTAASSSSTSRSTSAGANAGGRWRIQMHAMGDAEQLRIDFSSQPELGQDDIFLLLTIGLTRAELDQSQQASVGESVALEALGTLSGADRAVTKAIPVIDEFRFGSAYSPKTGRTEPTVTIGKRLAERIRANVTSGVSDSSEVRSNVEWRLNRELSVEGSYDNANDLSTSGVGNVGADIRWRLEFE